MSSGVAELRPVATPRVGQATAVEQSRAVAEVQAAVIVAQQCPRSVPEAIESMKEACRQVELAEQAFFRYPRADQTVEGPTVHLARELARCWGNIQYGIIELARDDARGESEMQAWAWDVQTNTRSSSTFIVPHKRDTKKGVRELTEMRDIYENNANNGARRLREAIFTMLPVWYRTRAERLCRQTIEDGGGVPLAERIVVAIEAFEKYRVSPARLAARFGVDRADQLSAADVAQLGVIYTSIQQGTVTVADEFPDEAGRITPGDLAPPKNVPPAGEQPAPPAATPAPPQSAGGTPRPPQQATDRQVTTLRMHVERLGYAGDRDGRLRATARLANLEPGSLDTSSALTREEAAAAIRRVKDLREATELAALLDELAGDPRDEEGAPGE